jgi:hypothetical protein
MSQPKKRGDTFSRDFEITDAEGDPVDLTGYTAACKMRLQSGNRVSDGSPAVTLTATLITPAAGTVRVSATAAETALWAPGRYVGDIEFTIGSTVFSTADFVQEILADRTF